jgi:hypothetical protein
MMMTPHQNDWLGRMNLRGALLDQPAVHVGYEPPSGQPIFLCHMRWVVAYSGMGHAITTHVVLPDGTTV